MARPGPIVISGAHNGISARIGEEAGFDGIWASDLRRAAETAAILAINPDLVDLDKANCEFPPFPEFTVNSMAVHTAFFFSAPGSVHAATRSGTWGEARGATADMGETYLQICVQSTLAVLDNIERTFAAMPGRRS